MIRVFLSHSSKDKPFVRELAEFLERDGEIGVWLDEREIAAGENIVGKIWRRARFGFCFADSNARFGGIGVGERRMDRRVLGADK